MNFGYIVVSLCSRNFLSKFTILISLIIISSHLHAQIDIKSKVDAQTYSEYSKAIDFFENNVSPNDLVTLFIPINYSLDRIPLNIYNSIFNLNDTNEKNLFINHYSIDGKLSESEIKQSLNSNNKSISKIFRSTNNYFFSMNDKFIMLSDNKTFEANIEKSITVAPNLELHFIKGIIRY